MAINSHDRATASLDDRTNEFGVQTVFDRFLDMQPSCKHGAAGLCCKFCSMGPCQMTDKVERSICGVDKHTVVMWNYSRNITAGVCQHSWHAYYYLDFLRQVLADKTQFTLRGREIGLKLAETFGVTGKTATESLNNLVGFFSDELTGSLRAESHSRIIDHLAPEKLVELWSKTNVLPHSPMVEVVRTMTRTSLGVESDPKELAMQTMKVGISDLINEFVAVSCHYVIHGDFKLKTSTANFGSIEEKKVNILLHGHVPVMPSVIAELADDPDLIRYAKEHGAEGINALGVCCTGNELFARYGVPLAGNFSQQELFIMTGAVDAFVVEQQCVLPTLIQMAENFHTLIVATDPVATMPGSKQLPVAFDKAYDQGRDIIRMAIDNYGKRSKVDISIPDSRPKMQGSFNVDNVLAHVGIPGLIDAIASGQLQGIVALAACNNPRIKHNYGLVTVAEELMKRDILLLATGCAAPALASAGLMCQDALAEPFTGAGLRRFCEKYELPPVLMFGSCISNSHIFYLCTQIAKALKCDVKDLPVAASAPEWMNEKLFPIATYLLGGGIMVHIGPPPPVMGSEKVISIFTKDIKDVFGGTLLIEPNPLTASQQIGDYLTQKRAQLLSAVG